MSGYDVSRRGVLRLVGAGLAVGTVGAGGASGATPGAYIVGTDSPTAAAAARGRADEVRRTLDFGDRGLAVAGRFSEAAVRGLARRPDVRYIEPDGLMHAIAIDAADSEVPWGIDRVDAEKAHATSDGSGGDVAIIDTGIDSDHPDLPNVGAGVAFTSASGSYAESWDDDNGHGTHCAGTAAAVDDGSGVVGVAPGATLHAVKVLDEDGAGYWSDVAAGIQYVADAGWDVGSMSLGGGPSRTVEDACRYAADRGVLLVAAAGNSSEDVANSAPATYDTVVAVSATDDRDRLASFSNYGSEIELAAPGVSITSTVPGGGYATYSGTSMACPHVAGGGAYLMAAGYTNAEARQALHDTAEDLGSSGRDETYGYGLLDVEAVVAAIGGDGGDTDPAVSTGSADVTTTTATLNGTLDDLGGADSADVYFEWGPSGDRSNTTSAETRTGTGSFSASLDGLADGESYEFRAVATAADGDTATGSTAGFTTTDDPAGVSTDGVSNVGDTSATLSGSLTDLGGADSADCGFEYSADGGSTWTATATESRSVTGGFTTDVTGLDAGTDYVFRAVATASDGDPATGSDRSFTTTGTTSSSPPTVTASATEAGSPNPHAEVTVDWTVSDADGDLTGVVVRVEATGDASIADTRTYDYAGVAGDSGSDEFKFKRQGGREYTWTVTATDGDGGTADATGTVDS